MTSGSLIRADGRFFSRGGDPGGVVSEVACAGTPSPICVSDSVVSVSEVACAGTPSAVCVSDSVGSVSEDACAVTPSAVCVSDSVVSVSEVACAGTPSAVCVSDSVGSVSEDACAVTPSAVCVSDPVGSVSEAHDVVTVAAEESRQAGLTVSRGLSLDSQNSRIHLGCLTHNSRIHSSHLASQARARSSVVSVTGDCCARFPRSFAAVVADVAMPDACVNGRNRGSRSHAFNSGGAGGLLPVCKSTSYHLDVCSQGPTGRKRVKGGVSGPAEDLLPVSEVEAEVNFRPAGGVRGQVAGSLPRRQQAQVPGRLREVWTHLPSTRRFLVSNSRHLGADWTSGNQWAGRRCVEPHGRGFGCWRVTPEPGLRQGTTVCVHTSMDMEQQSDHKLITPSGMGSWFVVQGRTLLITLVW